MNLEDLTPEMENDLSAILTPIQILQVKAKLRRQTKKEQDFEEIQTSIEFQDLGLQLYAVDLTNGYDRYNPFEISFPFKSLWVYNATDTVSTANLHLNSKQIPHILNGIPMVKNFAVSFPRTVGVAYLTATAQTSKYLYIIVLKDGTINPGVTLSQNAGGITINEGSSITTRVRTGLTLTTLTACELLPVNTSRNSETIQNHTGQVLWLGDANASDDTGNYPGIKFSPLDIYVHKNTAALYAYNPGATISNAKVTRNLEV